MSANEISAEDVRERSRVDVLDSFMTYVDTGGEGLAVVFLHGNPTSSYLWRNVITEVEPHARCLAPDLIGMGDSGEAADGGYRFVDHRRYLDAWFDAALPAEQLYLVGHDWGGALGIDWARRHPQRVLGIAYMETIATPIERWDDWPEAARGIFQGMRSEKGEELVLERNLFVERILPGSVLRGLTPQEMAVYNRRYKDDKAARRPTLAWPRELPIEGAPEDVDAIVAAGADWLAREDSPKKVFINAEPGAILTGPQREVCRGWPNQTEVTVKGSHFIQEDSPREIGQAVLQLLA